MRPLLAPDNGLRMSNLSPCGVMDELSQLGWCLPLWGPDLREGGDSTGLCVTSETAPPGVYTAPALQVGFWLPGPRVVWLS